MRRIAANIVIGALLVLLVGFWLAMLLLSAWAGALG